MLALDKNVEFSYDNKLDKHTEQRENGRTTADMSESLKCSQQAKQRAEISPPFSFNLLFSTLHCPCNKTNIFLSVNIFKVLLFN